MSAALSTAKTPVSRRRLLAASLPAALAAVAARRRVSGGESADGLPPVRAITTGLKSHWFSYYDKLQFDPTCRYALGMEVDFEHRTPKGDDAIRVGTIDLGDGDRWRELGSSRAWCWQQGCMLQWRPGTQSEILFNDRQGDQFVCHVLDVKSGRKRTVPHPIYAVSPDGRWAIAPDFRRVQDMRPGYGYVGLADPCADQLAPKDSGIWRVDLETGRSQLIISLADVAEIPYAHADLSKAKHWFNHLLVNTDGTRIEFLHRWRLPDQKGFSTRMLTAASDGSDVRVLIGSGAVSHFIWRDPTHILAYSKLDPKDAWGFLLVEDKPGGTVELIGKGVMTGDGHCSYLPGNQWIVCDTYPDRQRKQHVYLFHVPTGRRVPLGAFLLPKEYQGEWRCDTHPRFSPHGRFITIDSPHTGQGRQIHLIDVRAIVGT